MKILNHILEANFRAKRAWSHFKIHNHVLYSHLVWGRISLTWGQPHLMEITVCSHCNEEIQRVGEDYLDWCEGCQSLEGDTETITIEEFEARQ